MNSPLPARLTKAVVLNGRTGVLMIDLVDSLEEGLKAAMERVLVAVQH